MPLPVTHDHIEKAVNICTVSRILVQVSLLAVVIIGGLATTS